MKNTKKKKMKKTPHLLTPFFSHDSIFYKKKEEKTKNRWKNCYVNNIVYEQYYTYRI